MPDKETGKTSDGKPDELAATSATIPASTKNAPRMHPPPEEMPYEVEQRTDKPLDSKGELDGGGGPF